MFVPVVPGLNSWHDAIPAKALHQVRHLSSPLLFFVLRVSFFLSA
jgi:hypothetical protein